MLKHTECSSAASMNVRVAFEEAFINIANYAYSDSEGTVTVEIRAAKAQIEIRITDSGVPFNPLNRKDPDLNLSAKEKPIGGLGIVMIKDIMDFLDYEHADNKNIFTMKKITD